MPSFRQRKKQKKMNNYYDKQGLPISMVEWENLFEDHEYRIVKQEVLENGIFISTVWLGLDHSFGFDDKLKIFETMVFPSEGDYNDIDTLRYSSLEEAEKGHKELVKKWSDKKIIKLKKKNGKRKSNKRG